MGHTRATTCPTSHSELAITATATHTAATAAMAMVTHMPPQPMAMVAMAGDTMVATGAAMAMATHTIRKDLHAKIRSSSRNRRDTIHESKSRHGVMECCVYDVAAKFFKFVLEMPCS